MTKQLSDTELHSIRYEILTGDLSKHRAYDYWLSKWPNLVRSLGSHEELTANEFLKQDKLTLLLLDDRIVAMHMLKEYDRDQFSTEDFFKPFERPYFDALDARGVRRVQSLQWLMVDEEFSGNSFAAIIICLSLRNQVEAGLDASVAIARADNSVTVTAEKAGMEVFARSELHNVPVSHLACFQPARYPKETVAKLVDVYWDRRKYVSLNQSSINKAA